MIKKFLKRHSHVNWVLLDQGVISGVNFLTGLLIARFLGIEAFGVFTLVWMAVLFVSSIQTALIISPMMSIASKINENDLLAYYGAVLVQQVIFAIVSMLCLVAGTKLSVYFFPDWKISDLVFPLSLASFFVLTQDFSRRLFFVQGRYFVACVLDVVNYVGRLLLLIYFFIQDVLDVEFVLWGITVASVITIFVSCFIHKGVRWDSLVFKNTIKRHFVSARWLTGSALLQWLSGNLFIIVAASVLGAVAIGALKSAQNIMGITHIFLQGLENIVPTHASRYLHQAGKNTMVNYLSKVTFWSGIPMVIFSLLVSIYPEYILSTVFGEDYKGYGFVLRWYAVIYIIIFISFPLRMALRAMEKTSPDFFAYSLMSAFSIVIAKPIVESFGLHGVLIGMLLTGLIFFSTLLFFTKNVYSNYRCGVVVS